MGARELVCSSCCISCLIMLLRNSFGNNALLFAVKINVTLGQFMKDFVAVLHVKHTFSVQKDTFSNKNKIRLDIREAFSIFDCFMHCGQ